MNGTLRVAAPRRQDGVAWGWLLLWLAFLAEAVFVAPPADTALTHALLSGSFAAVDPAIAAIFSLLGVVPALASAFVLRDGATRRLPAWPFALGMFAAGAFALLPWMAFRAVGGPRLPVREPGRVRRGLARPWLRVATLTGVVACIAWALSGSAVAYSAAFRAVSLVHVMSLDLVVCTGLLAVLVEEARRCAGVVERPAARRLRFVPLLGSALWNVLVPRPA